jgi:hypothetical protein
MVEARAREHLPLAPPETRVVVNNWINALNRDACTASDRTTSDPRRQRFSA